MKARTFVSLMLLLLLFITVLLVFAAPRKQEAQKKDCCPAEPSGGNIQVQTADGGVIWESVSRHLLSVMQ